MRQFDPASFDFNKGPFIVIWEVTQECQLACSHCRASARQFRDPNELTRSEGFSLIQEVSKFEPQPLLVLTGGDPMRRPDLLEHVRYGVQKGLRVSVAPSATPLLTNGAVREIKAAGAARVSISLDGATAETHDSFRGVQGSFQWTIDALRHTRATGIPVQVNTTVSRRNLRYLKEIAGIVREFGAVLWDLFFLVPTGRARKEDMIFPEEHEEVLIWLYELAGRAQFNVKITEAPQYRRVVLQKQNGSRSNTNRLLDGKSFTQPNTPPHEIGRSTFVNDGKGFCFVSHIGDVCPSGFLPVSAGNVRQRSLLDIYQNSRLFGELRDPAKLKGKCGVCEFRWSCGGSRARAFALTGDYLAEDPWCVYKPNIESTTKALV